jgi:hypothetical protein
MWMSSDGILRTKDPAGVERALAGSVYDDTGWIAPALQSGWGQYAGWEPAGYRRINGIVYLRGLISGGTTTDGTLIFTLPAGFRPQAATTGKHISVASSNALGVIKVRENGRVECGTPVNASWLSFAGVSFPADDYVPPTIFTRALEQSPVTNGAKTTATNTTAFLRGSEVIVNVNVTANSALVAGDLLFTLPAGYRPSTTIFVDIGNANVEPPMMYRFHVMTDGGVQLQGSTGMPPSGALFRGSFTIPVALTVAYGGNPAADTGWINMPLANGWGTWDAGGWGVPQYRRKDGWVSFRGLISSMTATTDTMATLPVGFRPADYGNNMFVASYDTGTRNVNITSGGSIHAYSPGRGASYWSLMPVTYLAAE